MNEDDMLILIKDALNNSEESCNITSIRTFQEGRLLTYDKGLIVKMKDGSEFQITINQSELADRTNDEDDEDGGDE